MQAAARAAFSEYALLTASVQGIDCVELNWMQVAQNKFLERSWFDSLTPVESPHSLVALHA